MVYTDSSLSKATLHLHDFALQFTSDSAIQDSCINYTGYSEQAYISIVIDTVTAFFQFADTSPFNPIRLLIESNHSFSRFEHLTTNSNYLIPGAFHSLAWQWLLSLPLC